jgi:hypothetical protein
MLVWSLPSRSRIRKLPAIHMSCIRSWVSYPSLLQPRTNLSKKYAEKLYQNMVCLSLTCQKNSILHQNISGDYISTPYCRKVCMLIVFFFSIASSTSFVNVLTPSHEFYCILFSSLHGLWRGARLNRAKPSESLKRPTWMASCTRWSRIKGTWESSDTWATSVIKGLVRDTIIRLVL